MCQSDENDITTMIVYNIFCVARLPRSMMIYGHNDVRCTDNIPTFSAKLPNS